MDSLCSQLGFGLLVLSLGASACAPFNDSSTPSCALANSVYDQTIDVGPNESNWTNIAQAVVPTSTVSTQTVFLALQSNVASGSTLNGTLTLQVALDTVTTPGDTTPTSPSTAAGSATLSASSVGTLGGYYPFSFSTALNLAPNQVYWLVLSSTIAAGSTSFVEWLGSDIGAYSVGIGKVLTNGFGWQDLSGQTPAGATINGAGVNFAFEMGCPTS